MATDPAVIISARSLVKRFGTLTAVDGIDFDVLAGECFGFLGPNGAGKTSTIRMITCVSPVTEGELLVDGLDVRRDGRRIKARLGVVPQEDNLDPDLPVRQSLFVYTRYFDIPAQVARERIDEALALFQLQDRAKELVENLSGGMKRRLSIARALVSEPKILVLDEPTTGLDPQARHLVWQKLRLLKAQGVTMLLSTHNMEEATHLCEHIVIMHLGRILAQGAPADLIISHVGEEVLEFQATDREAKARALERLARLDGITVEDVEDLVYVLGLGPHGPQVASELLSLGQQARLRRATLEDVFLRLTGRGLTE